jgi:hypothetical protein
MGERLDGLKGPGERLHGCIGTAGGDNTRFNSSGAGMTPDAAGSGFAAPVLEVHEIGKKHLCCLPVHRDSGTAARSRSGGSGSIREFSQIARRSRHLAGIMGVSGGEPVVWVLLYARRLQVAPTGFVRCAQKDDTHHTHHTHGAADSTMCINCMMCMMLLRGAHRPTPGYDRAAGQAMASTCAAAPTPRGRAVARVQEGYC